MGIIFVASIKTKVDKKAKKKRKRELKEELHFYLDYYKEVTSRGDRIKEVFDREIEAIIEELKEIGK